MDTLREAMAVAHSGIEKSWFTMPSQRYMIHIQTLFAEREGFLFKTEHAKGLGSTQNTSESYAVVVVVVVCILFQIKKDTLMIGHCTA